MFTHYHSLSVKYLKLVKVVFFVVSSKTPMTEIEKGKTITKYFC